MYVYTMVCYNDVITYVILGFLAVFVFIFIFHNKTKEGFTDRENISEVIKNEANKLNDTLLVSKYRSSYEDTIIHLENVVGLSMLNETINNAELISKNPSSKESIQAIENINKLKQFKETLNETMVILDKAS